MLKIRGLHFRTLEEAFAKNVSSRGNICLTFDDGNKSDVDLVLPMLLEVSAKATFFITTDWIGQPSFLSVSNIRELHNHGMQIGSHSKSHLNLKYLSHEEIKEELASSKKVLEDIIGAPVDAFSYPFGEHWPSSYKIARDVGYIYCCNSRHGIASFKKPYLSRNSINKHTQISKVTSIVKPSLKVRTLWHFEDIVKKLLKTLLRSRYIKFREALFGKN